MSTHSLPSQLHQQAIHVPPVLRKSAIDAERELAIKANAKLSKYLCRFPDCNKEFVTELGLCKKHSAEVCGWFTTFYDSAMAFVEALALMGLGLQDMGNVGVVTGDPFLTRCDRFLNDATPNWFDDREAHERHEQDLLGARKAKTERRKHGEVTTTATQQPMARRARAS